MGIAILLIGLGLLCVLLYNIAVFAMPVFVGAWAGIWAFNSGAGIGCVLVGLVAGGAVFLLGQLALTSSNPVLRWIIIALFVLPAVVAGYGIVMQLSEIGIPSLLWRHVFAIVGGIVVGCSALARLTAPIGHVPVRA